MSSLALRRAGVLAACFALSSTLLGAQCAKKKGDAVVDAGAPIAADTSSAATSATASAAASASAAPAADEAGTTAQADPADAGASTSSGTPATLEAANANKIGRYKDETKIDNETTKLLQGGIVRTFPTSGEYITFLNGGVEVTKVASRQDAFLVTFPNPKANTEKLAGWVDGTVFKAVPDAGPPKTISCKLDKDCKVGGQLCVLTGIGRSIETCVTPCGKTPPVCAAAMECSGESVRPGTGEFVPFCQPAKPKPAAVDAGAKPVATSFKAGEKVDVLWKGQFYPATVLAQKGALYRIHYDGYDASWDEDVGTDRMRKR